MGKKIKKKNYTSEKDNSNIDKNIDKENNFSEDKIEKKDINNNSSDVKIEKNENLDKTFSTSSIDTDEINDLIDEDLGKKKKVKKVKKHVLIHLFLILVLFISIGYFASTLLNTNNSVIDIVTGLIITLFTIFFVIVGISYKSNNKGLVFISSILLLGYLIIGINNNLSIFNVDNTMEDFTGKSLTSVIKWANKNNITVNQDYEYSDMVTEYKVISQDIQEGESLNDVSEMLLQLENCIVGNFALR